MKKYPHTGQYGEFIRALRMQHGYKGKDELGNSIYENTTDYPIVNLKGTVKLHGTNFSFHFTIFSATLTGTSTTNSFST